MTLNIPRWIEYSSDITTGTLSTIENLTVDYTLTNQTVSMDGIYNYNNFVMTNSVINVGSNGLTINANSITIDSTSVINANSVGYGAASGPGAGTSRNNESSGGGGGYGGSGGSGGGVYGTASGADIDKGSGGGNIYTYGSLYRSGGTGGGLVSLNGAVIKIYGQAIANGGSGGSSSNQNVGASGGGSGGGILISGSVVDITNATLRANGGSGGNGNFYSFGAGGGGGGRIKIFSTYIKNIGSTITASGGGGGSGGLAVGQPGSIGSITFTQNLSQSVAVIINANPVGSEIIVNGVNTGLTTHNTINLIPGTYQLTLSYPCYENSIEMINAVLGDVVTIGRNLTKNTGDFLSISSTPSGADVYISGVHQPTTTPIIQTCVTEGIYPYVISISGYQAYRGSYNIVRSTSTTVDAALLPFGLIETGSIDITSNPTGANIFLDDTDKSVVTPSVFTNVPIGSHIIRLTKTGYIPVEKTITVAQDTTESVQMTLYPEGSLSFVSTPSGAEIFLALTGQTPEDQGIVTPTTISLPIGSYDYILRLYGYSDMSGTVYVMQGVTTPISVDLIPSQGCISFSTDVPGASIRIDGTLQEGATTPATICGLTIGPHTYELALIGYQTVTGDVTLTTGNGETVSTTLVSCIQNWVCRQPLDGYEHDTNNCGTSDRLNSACNAPPIPSQGCISFSTDVPGASIRIDGTLQEGATTPATICGLTIGPHTYELALIGYQTVTGDVTLTTGNGETVSTTLVSCIQNWVCRQPLDGYEHDTNNCGTSDRLNSACNAPAHIISTELLVSTDLCVEPCAVNVDATWTNDGSTTGSFVPNVTVNNEPIDPLPYPSEDLAPGASTTHTFSLSDLMADTYVIRTSPGTHYQTVTVQVAPVAEAGMGGIGMLLVAGLAFGAIMTSGNKGPKTRKLEQTYTKDVASTGK